MKIHIDISYGLVTVEVTFLDILWTMGLFGLSPFLNCYVPGILLIKYQKSDFIQNYIKSSIISLWSYIETEKINVSQNVLNWKIILLRCIYFFSLDINSRNTNREFTVISYFKIIWKEAAWALFDLNSIFRI